MKSGMDFDSINKKFGSKTCPKSVSGFMNPTIFNLKMANIDFALQCPLWPQSKNQKKRFLGKALSNTLTDQSS